MPKDHYKIDGSMHQAHRLRMKQKFLEYGIGGFADHEIIEFLLFYAIPRKDVNPLAHKLISHFGSLSAVLEASVDSLMQVDGIGEHSAILINLFFNFLINITETPTCAPNFLQPLLQKPIAKLFLMNLPLNNFLLCAWGLQTR